MLIREICTSEVVCCGPTTSALEAAKLMRGKHVGDVVVVDNPAGDRVPLGIVTDRDLAIEVLGNERDAATMEVTTFMRRPVVIARETEDTSQIIERMRMHGVRRLPVVDGDERLVGIVALDDLLRALVADMSGLLETQYKGQRHERAARRG